MTPNEYNQLMYDNMRKRAKRAEAKLIETRGAVLRFKEWVNSAVSEGLDCDNVGLLEWVDNFLITIDNEKASKYLRRKTVKMSINHRVKFTSVPSNSGSVWVAPEHVEAVEATSDATLIEMVSGKIHTVEENVFKVIDKLQDE